MVVKQLSTKEIIEQGNEFVVSSKKQEWKDIAGKLCQGAVGLRAGSDAIHILKAVRDNENLSKLYKFYNKIDDFGERVILADLLEYSSEGLIFLLSKLRENYSSEVAELLQKYQYKLDEISSEKDLPEKV